MPTRSNPKPSATAAQTRSSTARARNSPLANARANGEAPQAGRAACRPRHVITAANHAEYTSRGGAQRARVSPMPLLGGLGGVVAEALREQCEGALAAPAGVGGKSLRLAVGEDAVAGVVDQAALDAHHRVGRHPCLSRRQARAGLGREELGQRVGVTGECALLARLQGDWRRSCGGRCAAARAPAGRRCRAGRAGRPVRAGSGERPRVPAAPAVAFRSLRPGRPPKASSRKKKRSSLVEPLPDERNRGSPSGAEAGEVVYSEKGRRPERNNGGGADDETRPLSVHHAWPTRDFRSHSSGIDSMRLNATGRDPAKIPHRVSRPARSPVWVSAAT
jgi:hypothetical protein